MVRRAPEGAFAWPRDRPADSLTRRFYPSQSLPPFRAGRNGRRARRQPLRAGHGGTDTTLQDAPRWTAFGFSPEQDEPEVVAYGRDGSRDMRRHQYPAAQEVNAYAADT